MRRASILLLFLLAISGGCHRGTRAPEVLRIQTIDRLGAGQGVSVIGGKVYLFGDAETGVICEHEFVAASSSSPSPALVSTGREIRLTVAGADTIAHPTGLTTHSTWGTFLGDTRKKVGTIYHIDLPKLLRDRNLDRAILNITHDDAAVQGSRPEFVRVNDRWLVATSDYGPSGNEIRLLDPEKLSRAKRTSEPGVVVRRIPCGPWVQSLHWIDESSTLVLVQNITEGLGWRLTFVDLAGKRPSYSVDIPSRTDELEGYTLITRQIALAVSSSRNNNIVFVRTTPQTK